MYLSEVFNALTHGELSQLSIGGFEFGEIRPENHPKLVTLINSGLIELYKRFNLSTKDVNVDLYNHINAYTLHTDYLNSNTTSIQPYKYLSDSSYKPFTNDILLISNVYNEAGDEYPINEIDEEYSVFTPMYNVLQVPFAQIENSLGVTYRASPEKLSLVQINPETDTVPIPDSMLECLVAYVVSKIHSSGPAGEGNQAGLYYNKFIASCALIDSLGLVHKSDDINRKLDTQGWV